MRHRMLWAALAWLVAPLALAQVSTSTASFANLTLTSVDLDPDDANVPLAFGVHDLVFTSKVWDPATGGFVTLVSQNAALPFAAAVASGDSSVVQVNNDGAGQVAMTATASGSGAREVSGVFSIDDNPLSPMIVQAHTAARLTLDYLVARLPSGYDLSAARSLAGAWLILELPGLPPVSAGPSYFFGNAQGSFQAVVTNDSDLPGRLIVRMFGDVDAVAGVVPEPSTSTLWLLGLAATTVTVRKLQNRQRQQRRQASTPR